MLPRGAHHELEDLFQLYRIRVDNELRQAPRAEPVGRDRDRLVGQAVGRELDDMYRPRSVESAYRGMTK